MLWIFPHILASALIIYFFAYLTHKPHEVHERYRDTNVFWVKGKIMEPIVNWLYLFQNFHLIHHLFPRVPFYNYPKAFRSLKPVLDQRAGPHLRVWAGGARARFRRARSSDPVSAQELGSKVKSAGEISTENCWHQITTLGNLARSTPAGIGYFWLPLNARKPPRSTNIVPVTWPASRTFAMGTR